MYYIVQCLQLYQLVDSEVEGDDRVMKNQEMTVKHDVPDHGHIYLIVT